MPPAPDRVKAVFMAALDADPAARPAVLDGMCAGDEELRRRVEAMLRANDRADPLLDQPAADLLAAELPAVAAPDPTEERGTVIAGRYRLREVIGEGGMGSVWLADQTEPVRRTVALKLIKVGMDSRSVLARFEAERQALAVMDHPHIAKVLDGGTTEAGRPFFVMEYVPGISLTEYCDAERVDVPGRLALFVQICQAVQHAHQKGVIHRDLKPSNILVRRTEAGPVPKVIDFGLAKAVRQPLTEATLETGPGMLLGTLQYMAPEQAELDNADIDTRADVYALGVILYELLTGTTPVERQRLKKAAWLEVLRLIREEEPPRPSTRLSGSGSLPSVAAQRNLEPVRLTRLVRGDLDWIVMKALEKDRARRYDSATGFAADVQRYLIGDPVAAHPPSAGYRLRKFVRRNRPQVVAAGLVLAALVAGIVGTTAGLVEARRQKAEALEQERQAREERDAKEAARRAEAEQRALAEDRLVKFRKGVQILGSVFTKINPKAEQQGGDPLPVALGKQLERAADELKGEAAGDPGDMAGLQTLLGNSLSALERYPKAIEVYQAAVANRTARLGEDHVDTLITRAGLAGAYVNSGDVPGGLAMYEAIVPALARQRDRTNPYLMGIRGDYAHALMARRRPKEAVAVLTEVVADFRAAGLAEDRLGLNAGSSLAQAHFMAGDRARAVDILEPLLPVCEAKLGNDDTITLMVRNGLAGGYHAARQFDKCLEVLRPAYEAARAKFREDHSYMIAVRSNLAIAARAAGEYQEAVDLYKRLLAVYEAKNGPTGRTTLTTCLDIGRLYVRLDRPDLALSFLERAWKGAATWPPDGPEATSARDHLARAYTATGQPARAVPLFEAALAANEKRPPSDPVDLVTARANLADALSRAGQFARAAQVHEAGLAATEAKLGPDHPATLLSRNHLAGAYRDLGRSADALRLLEQNVPLAVAKLGESNATVLAYRLNLLRARTEAGGAAARPDLEALVGQAGKALGETHPVTLLAVHGLADALEKEKAWDRAVAERQRVVAAERQRGRAGPPLTTALFKLGQTLLAAGRFAAAEPPLRETGEILDRDEPESWERFAAKSMLGEALAGQKKYEAAEPLLLEGHRGLKDRAGLIPQTSPQLPRAGGRLVHLYEAWGKPAEAAKWRAEGEKK
jgi:eukaryotic-like serine/threonine-protein kinase